jgi:hypothetical protein
MAESSLKHGSFGEQVLAQRDKGGLQSLCDWDMQAQHCTSQSPLQKHTKLTAETYQEAQPSLDRSCSSQVLDGTASASAPRGRSPPATGLLGLPRCHQESQRAQVANTSEALFDRGVARSHQRAHKPFLHLMICTVGGQQHTQTQ